ncbi:bifunctional diaminohydroxyphosphoribosylaminopyrimidine deaminase/5-amino-6-(5-phosphoribosylamino)uracil reductase RibD [Pseudochelatococcus sp. B33]
MLHRPDNHQRWMAEAVALARTMLGRVWPNPAVGCVIVRDSRIVGRGQTQIGGRPHAERVALDDAGEQARGATLYVTLEPCCHWGRTPPCADAIISAGVTHVHASLQDPDPRVNGGGFRKLRETGVEVTVGLAADEARDIMAGFFHRIATGRPLVRIGEVPQSPMTIPNGFDARVMSEAGRLRLLTRTQDRDALVETMPRPDDPATLLDLLGQRGLTTLLVSGDDPLARDLALLSIDGFQPSPRTVEAR